MKNTLQTTIAALLCIVANRATSAAQITATQRSDYGSTGDAKDCCSNLKAQLHSKVLLNHVDNFTADVEPYWSAQAQDQVPACVVLPTRAEDVSIAIKVFRSGCHANLHHGKVAIRSGGHTPIRKFNNIDGGVTLDLSKLNMVETNEHGNVTKIGPGNRWVDVYNVLDASNLTVVGGRSKTVGVGGLVASGGMSFFSARYGMPCDNVVNYEVVLPNGTITHANATYNLELYTSLKGGSGHFGVVTRLDMYTFPQKEFWGGQAVYNASSVPDLFPIFTKFASSQGYDDYSQVTLLYGSLEGTRFGLSFQHYTAGLIAPPPEVFGEFAPYQVQNTFRVSTLANFTVELEGQIEPLSSRKLFATTTTKNSLSMTRAFYALANETFSDLESAKIPGMHFVISLQPFGPYITGKSKGSSGNFLGLAEDNDEDKDRVLFCLTVEWGNEEDDARMNAAVKTLVERANKKAEELGVSDPYIFQNYAAKWQDVYAGVGQQNRVQWSKIRKEYDADGLWEQVVSGGFEL